MSTASLNNVVASPRLKGGSCHLALTCFPGFIFILMLHDACALQLPARWRWSNPAEFGGNIFDMTYGLGLTVAVAERGQVYTSDDLVLWEPRGTGVTNSLRAVTFFGPRLIITGESGTVLYADSLQEFHAVSLGTSDWLEGVTASTNLLVAVGDNGAIYCSDTGADWARQSTSITSWLTSVVWGQGTFVTVGDHGFIATSPNGSNWTKRTSGTTRDLKRVFAINNQFWALGDGGLILTSPAGVNWSPLTSNATNTLFGADGTPASQLAVGNNEVRLRLDSEWLNELTPTNGTPAPLWTYYNALWEGSLFLISGRSGMRVEGFQTNEASPFLWVDRSRPIRNWLWELRRTPDFYVTVGYRGTVMTSADGIEWSLELVPDSVTNTTFFGVGGTSNLLVAVGEDGQVILSQNTPTDLIITNSDGSLGTNTVSSLGIFWTAIPPPTTNALQGVTVLGDKFVLTGDLGTVLCSPDGTNWTQQTTPTANFLTGVAAFPGGLVAVGQGGTLLTSPDGISWKSSQSGTTNWLYRVRYLGGKLVAVGQNGTVLTSDNGRSWTEHPTPTTRWLNDVTLLADTYFAVGNQGAVLASTNAEDWIYLGTITEKSLYGVACNSGQLVAAGVEGAIVRSQIIPDLTPVHFLSYSRRDAQNAYLIAGKPDQRFTLDETLSLTNWMPGLLLEFLDASGTLLVVESVPTNPPPTGFYRGTVVP